MNNNDLTKSNLTDNNNQTNIIETKSLSTLTKKDWLFINYKLQGFSTLESYKLSGFKGRSPDAPYVLYNALKTRILTIQDTNFDRSRLIVEMNKALNMPLDPAKTTVTFNEKLKSIRLASNLIPEAKEPKALTITNFTINRFGVAKETVIEAEIVPLTNSSPK